MANRVNTSGVKKRKSSASKSPRRPKAKASTQKSATQARASGSRKKSISVVANLKKGRAGSRAARVAAH